MPGGIVKSYKDRVVDSIPERDRIAARWNKSNWGQGVIVLNAYAHYPDVDQGDPTVLTACQAYYKFTSNGFIKIAEGESLDQTLNPLYTGASPATIALGGITPGTELQGRTLVNIIEQALVVYQQPTFSAFSVNGQPIVVEVGSSFSAGLKTFTWSTTNTNNVKPNSISIFNQTLGTILLNAFPNNGNAQFNFPNQYVLNNEEQTLVFNIQGENTQNQKFARNFTITANYLRFFGCPQNTPTQGQHVRQLGNQTFGNNFTIPIPQGSTIIAFAYEANRPNISNASVKYVEGFNANVGNTFAQTIMSVADPSGAMHNYKVYIATLGAPYLSSATYQVTIP
ncbi:MAG: hypothetical protein O9340_12095 [Cyclobacteriaceae bacterium]|nr:hypothetical protein [Cyclobacteriaceae bacterium]